MTVIKRLMVFPALILILFIGEAHVSKAFNVHHDLIKSAQLKTSQDLIASSDLIILAEIQGVSYQFNTGRHTDIGKFINYVQPLSVKTVYKGSEQHDVHLLTTGIYPLPKPENPLNNLYPGAIENGTYLTFLKKIPGTPYYQLNGGWQGLYPLINGRTFALSGGFTRFNDLAPKDINHIIKTRNGEFFSIKISII
ncbi:hypothetical protein [Scopulibacillus cellulosilyticus]|uniref:Uncharacterized protein n=1 Tax=Scopulibacillus cellulosilyticus TaxID=2665665 RepID=A0ABW2PWK9_9BACL